MKQNVRLYGRMQPKKLHSRLGDYGSLWPFVSNLAAILDFISLYRNIIIYVILSFNIILVMVFSDQICQ